MSESMEGPGVDLQRPSLAPPAPILVTVLQVLGVGLVSGGLAMGGVVLHTAPRGSGPSGMAIVTALSLLIAGTAGGAVLWALGWLVRHQHETADVRERLLRALEGGRGGAAAHGSRHATGSGPVSLAEAELAEAESSSELLQRLLGEIMEMNANLLMSQDQREAKGRQRQERLAREVTGAFAAALVEHAFARAETCIKQFEDDLPDDDRVAEMQSRLAEARKVAEARDVEDATRRANDLMAVSSFVEAQQTADGLLLAYPSSEAAGTLVDRVQRESKAFFREQRQRLYAEVQRNADARRWRKALDAARQLVETYGDSTEADEARAMLATLEGNARIEEVRQLRDRIRDMIKRRRYAEAVNTAREVLHRFPDSQAANDLRGQMARLEELAAEEGQ